MRKNTKEKGRSMIEMLGVLAIVGVLSVGGLVGYNMAMRKIMINAFVDEFMQVVQKGYELRSNIRQDETTLKEALPAYLLSDLKKKAMVLSPDMQVTSRAVAHSYGYFEFVMNKVPTDVCQALTHALSGVSVTIGSDEYGWVNPAKDKNAAQNLCRFSSTTESGYISFNFTK